MRDLFYKISCGILFTLLVVFHSNCQLTTVNLNAQKDSRIATWFMSNTNFGSDTMLRVGTDKSGMFVPQHHFRTFVEFDLSTIPSNAIISSAEIKFKRISSVSGSNPWRTKLVKSFWYEDSITASNQPVISTDAADISSTYSSSNDTISFDVTDMTQRMVYGQISNYGWSIQVLDETYAGLTGATFYSRESVTFTPYLEVKYYFPIEVVNLNVMHESYDGAGDGYLDPTLQYGSGSYSYQWLDGATETVISTDTILDSLSAGWYGLIATDTIGYTLYQAFLVGVDCDTAVIEFDPGPNYIDDAMFYDLNSITKNTNYGNYSAELASNGTSSGNWFDARTLMKFRMWIDTSVDVSSAELKLTGSSKTPSFRSNQSRLKKITSYWDEFLMTYNAQPTYSTSDTIHIPEMTSDTEIKYIETAPFWTDWQTDNSSNYGMLFELDLYDDTYAKQQYYSSDNSDTTKHPLITFTIYVNNPQALACNPDLLPYKELKRKLDGGHALTAGGKLKFAFKEEYSVDTSEYLVVNVYDDTYDIIASCNRTGTTSGGMTALKYNFDDNRYTLDVGSITGITGNKYYVLELLTSKGEKRYLRFLYIN